MKKILFLLLALLTAVFTSTDDVNLRAFQRGEIDKLGLVNAGGVGYTYENLDNVLLVQTDSNRLGNTFQKIARNFLYRPNYTAKIFIIYAKDTRDEVWLNSFLEDVDRSKIQILNV